MELKEFIRESLVHITEGVIEAEEISYSKTGEGNVYER